MSRSAIALNAAWRDYWGMWSPLVEPWIAPLEESKCHAPRLCVLPELGLSVVPASGKIEYNFHLVPGSLIWAMWVDTVDNARLGDFAVQLTDVALGHSFFQEPMTADQLQTTRANEGFFPSYTLWGAPHPVVGEGLFQFEAWGAPGSYFTMLLGVAEVTECPYR